MQVAAQLERREDVERLYKSCLITTSADIKEGDFRELIKLVPSESVDCICSDPPFGYDELTESEGKTRGGTQQYQGLMKPTDNLSLGEVRELMQALFPEMHRILRPGCHFYLFFSLDLYQPLQSMALSSGLKTHKTPLIWTKDGENTTPFNGFNYMSCYEAILFGWKPMKGVPEMKRLNDPMKNVLSYKTVKRDHRHHVFHKPSELISALLKNSTNLGDLVLDPMCGSGEVVKTAKLIGRSGLGFEIDHENFIEAQMNLKEA
jgi:DNA modification methylase